MLWVLRNGTGARKVRCQERDALPQNGPYAQPSLTAARHP
jgi:hypothetical protein